MNYIAEPMKRVELRTIILLQVLEQSRRIVT
jgi:hypothetical protein